MTRRLATIALLALVVSGCSSAPTVAPSPTMDAAALSIPALQGKTADESARRSLEEFRALVTADDAATLGFTSADEAATAALGRSLAIWAVPLDQLRAYDSAADPNGLLVDSGEVIVEVTVDGDVRSAVRVGKVGDVWQGEGLGWPALIGALAAMHTTDDEFVVWVPAMNVYLVGRRSDGSLIVTPAFDYPEYELFTGDSLPANEAFGRLAGAAPTDGDVLN